MVITRPIGGTVRRPYLLFVGYAFVRVMVVNVLVRIMVVNSSNVAEAATLLVAHYMPLLWNSTSLPSLWGRGEGVGLFPNKKTAGSTAPSR